ncbi:protein spire homolog 1 [Polyodon spathula]|uniref:protein spire homolog 1 n=1 Tax=Polyodon spathula TaxID=7913 RepID=UPI001B7F560A|nr:protein spire homolog 1 [Polyodon spathula]
MAKRGDDGAMLIPTAVKDKSEDTNLGGENMDCGDGEGLSLEEILKLYNQPINEEQAWAVCYQCCGSLLQGSRRRHFSRSAGCYGRRIEGAADVWVRRDGTVLVQDGQDSPDKSRLSMFTAAEVIESLGIVIYKALDYGLKENEERELSPPLEHLIDRMTNFVEDRDVSRDEGFEATEEEDEEDKEPQDVTNLQGFRDVLKLCAAHLPSPSDAPDHYQAVCRALYTETKDLGTFLEKIKSAKENLRKMEGVTTEESNKDLDEPNFLILTHWGCPFKRAQSAEVLVHDREPVGEKETVFQSETPKVPSRFQTALQRPLTQTRSYWNFAHDGASGSVIARSFGTRLSKKATGKRVLFVISQLQVNRDIPPKLKKSAHEIILDFIRSRPPLNPVTARKLKPIPWRPRSLHERILEEIKAERKLRPVSPDEIRRSRQDVSTSEAHHRAGATALANGAVAAQSQLNSVGTAHTAVQRKRLLKAPTLAELDSSDSEEECSHRSASSTSVSTSQMEDTSPESAVGKKTYPRFLPISSTPQPERRQTPQRRHSIEKETPTNVRQFLPPSRQNSKSLEEFCYPVECLALTVEEVMHIRQVLVKAELEKFQQYKDVYNALKKGKLCFCCRTKRFSFFTWSYTCQFCKRPVCSQCCKKMRLPSKPYANLPIYSLGSSTLHKEESVPKPEKPSTSLHRQHSLYKTVSRFSPASKSVESSDDLELPKELTEDWSTMEVCVDCKMFISEIICSSKRSLVLATKRARLKRKTRSFYVSSPGTSDYRPSERTIKEV